MPGDRMTDRVGEWCAENAVYGASAGVGRVGAAPVVASWGLDGRNPDTPMAPDRRFRIASVTKTFTSALVLDLVDRGVLSLSSTVDAWLPRYPHAAEMTVRSLLDHTAGTADPLFDDLPAFLEVLLSDLDRRFMPAELVELTVAREPHARPGETYRYSNTDYNILGLVVEQVSDASFATLLDRRIAAPLGLRATGYDDRVADDLVHGWFDFDASGDPSVSSTRDVDVRDFPNTALISSAFAAGGVTSTLVDLLTWARALYLGSWLSPSMRATLLDSTAVAAVDGVGRGLGVVGYGEHAADGSWECYGHAGNIVGSSAFIAAFPLTGTTVAIHANVQEVETDALVELARVLAATA